MNRLLKMVRGIGLAILFSTLFVQQILAQDPLNGWQAKNEGTQGIVLASVTESGEFTSLSFKNTSDKTVTAFAISFLHHQEDPNGLYFIDCFDAPQDCVTPGATLMKKFTTASLNELPDHTVRIVAVLYADGSSEGSWLAIQFITSGRLGEILETARIRKVLDDLMPAQASDQSSKSSKGLPTLDNNFVTSLEKSIGSPAQSVGEVIQSIKGIRVPGASLDDLDVDNKNDVAAFCSGVNLTRTVALNEMKELRRLPIASSGNAQVLTRPQYFIQLRRRYDALATQHLSYTMQAHRRIIP